VIILVRHNFLYPQRDSRAGGHVGLGSKVDPTSTRGKRKHNTSVCRKAMRVGDCPAEKKKVNSLVRTHQDFVRASRLAELVNILISPKHRGAD
jgi:hypothetical protein